MLMLTLEDAVKVATRLIRGYDAEFLQEDEEFLRQEFEQKCWLPGGGDETPGVRLHGLIDDIRPVEICAQIESDNLGQWCEIIQANMITALAELGRRGEE